MFLYLVLGVGGFVCLCVCVRALLSFPPSLYTHTVANRQVFFGEESVVCSYRVPKSFGPCR